jgi:phosphate-selective porin
MTIVKKTFFPLLILLFVSLHSFAEVFSDSMVADTVKAEEKKFLLTYGKKGFIFEDKTGNYMMNVEFRGQFRFSYPTDSDPVNYDDYDKKEVYLAIRRARIKVGGHSYRPWLKYYFEYELFASNLLDFRLMFEKFSWFKIKVGQWKVQYNRERIISSGKQQTAERSILTREFTIDRQQGISFYGNIDAGGMLNFNYWFSIFMGTGRGARGNDDKHLMYMTRLQWNPNGRVLKFSSSDIEYHKDFTMLVAVAGVTNRSPYTRFSQSGGGELEGFQPGVDGQYRVNQCLEETAFKFRGLSWQQEFHYKQILDKINNTDTRMLGNLAQIGYFFHGLWKPFPKHLEAYVRHAFYYPEVNRSSVVQSEVTFGFNYFVSGHRFKLTAETSYLGINEEGVLNPGYPGQIEEGWRMRLQLDISF